MKLAFKNINKREIGLAFLGLVAIAFLLAYMGKAAQKQTVAHFDMALQGFEAKYAFLYDHFGQAPHFYQSISTALIVDGYSVLELLAIDEDAVLDESKANYASLSLPPLPDVIHLHTTTYGAHTAITVGGYPLTALKHSEQGVLVMVIENVSASTIQALQETTDKTPFNETGDNKGRVRYSLSDSGYRVQLRGTKKFIS